VAWICHGEVIETLVANRLTAPAPLVRVQERATAMAVKEAYGIEPHLLNDDRIARPLDAVAPQLDAIVGGVGAAVIGELGVVVARLHWDMTSISLHAAYPGPDGEYPAPRWGHPKDRWPPRGCRRGCSPRCARGGHRGRPCRRTGGGQADGRAGNLPGAGGWRDRPAQAPQQRPGGAPAPGPGVLLGECRRPDQGEGAESWPRPPASELDKLVRTAGTRFHPTEEDVAARVQAIAAERRIGKYPAHCHHRRPGSFEGYAGWPNRQPDVPLREAQ